MQSVDRRALVVLGMHRSGTSAVAGALAKLGATAPRSRGASATDNPKGFWEPLPIVALNDELLASIGNSWDDWSLIDPMWFDTPAAGHFAERALQLLAAEFGDGPVIVLKDPRICRLMPFWTRVLEQANLTPLVIVPLRMPLEVAFSLQQRNRFPVSKGLLLWLRHVLDAEVATRHLKRSFVEWDAFLVDWRTQVGRLAHEFGVVLPHGHGGAEAEVDAFLDMSFKRHRVSHDQPVVHPGMHDAITATFAALRALVNDPMDGNALAELDQARRLFDHACSLFHPVLSDLRSGAEREKADADRHWRDLTEVLNRQHEAAIQRIGELTEALEQERIDRRTQEGELAEALARERVDRRTREDELAWELGRERHRAATLETELSFTSRQLEIALRRWWHLGDPSYGMGRFLRRFAR